MKIRQDNRGLSLVELIIAVTVSLVVLSAVTLFMYSAQKSYKLAAETIDLQVEAQLLMEQLGNWVMESNHVEVVTDTSTGIIGEILVLYDIPQNNGREASDWVPGGYTAGDTSATKRIIWAKDGKLYMKKITGIANAATEIDAFPYIGYSLNFTEESAKDENLIGELVQQCVIGYDKTNAPNKVSIELILKRGNLSYNLKNNFKVRNRM